MIGHLLVKFWKWQPNASDASERLEPYYIGTSGEFDIDIATRGLIGANTFSIKVEGDGDKLAISNVTITLGNRAIDVIGLDIDSTLGDINANTWGLVQPLFDSGGIEVIVAEVRVYALHNKKLDSDSASGVYPHGDMILGDVSSYEEFIEGYESKDYVVPFIGYIEMTLTGYNEYSGTGSLQLLALDKLLGFISMDTFELTPLFSIDDLIDSIIEKFPFVETSSATDIAVGSINWIVPQIRDYYLAGDDLTLDHFERIPEDNAKLVVWKYYDTVYGTDMQIFYFKIQDSLAGEYGTLTIESDNAFSLSVGETIPSALTHNNPGGSYFNRGSDFNTGTSQRLDWQFNGVDQCETYGCGDDAFSYTGLNETTLDLFGFDKIPFHGKELAFKSEGSAICTRPNDIKNFSPAYPAYLFNFKSYPTGPPQMMSNRWDLARTPDNYTADSFSSLANWSEIARYETPTSASVIWRKGFRRFFIISSDKKTVWTYPSPEVGIYNAYTNNSPFPAGRPDDESIYTVGIELGANDDFPVVNDGLTTEREYRKYPTWTKRGGRAVVKVYAKAKGADSFDIDDDYSNGGSSSDAYNDGSITQSDFYKYIALDNSIPSDLPINPVFRYSGDEKLEIWYYSNDDKMLKCYDWKMNLKYGYFLNVDFSRVALGRDRNGKLLIVITTDDQIIVARHEPTSTLYYPEIDIDLDATNASNLLTNFAKWGFGAWWIDRRNGQNTFNFKPRYQGDERGGIVPITHSGKGDLGESSNRQPNRTLTREFWDKYAEQVIVKSTLGEMARIGLVSTPYTFTYNFPAKLYHMELGNRVGQQILAAIGTRRAKLHVPLGAYYTGIYDFVTVFGRQHCVLSLTSDYSDNLTTDLEVVEMDRLNYFTDVLDCVLPNLYSQGGYGWGYYTPPPYSEGCFCGVCIDYYNALMDIIVEILESEFSLSEGSSGELDSEIVVAITTILYDLLSHSTTGTALELALSNYRHCVITSCDFGGD